MKIENLMKSGKLKLIVFLILAMMVQSVCGDYLTFHADAQRTGNVSDPGPDAPNLLWKQKITNHAIYGGSAISGDRVYVSDCWDMSFSGEQALGCLGTINGSVLWLNPIGGKGGASTPTIKGDRVFVGSFTGDLHCVNATSGETIWNKTLETKSKWWGLISSPLVLDDEIFVTSFADGTLHVLDFEGTEKWNISTSKTKEFTSPASWKGKVYFAGGDPALYCVDASSHSVLWTFLTDSQVTTTPSIWNDRVFFATDSSIFALNATSGEELWKNDLKGTISSPAVSYGRVYIGTGDSRFCCFDARGGKLLWSTDVNGPVKSSPVVAENMAYFGTNTGEGTFYALDALNGSVIWTYPVNEYIMSSPSVSDGVLFIGADDSYIYAFGPEPSKVIWNDEVRLPEGSFNLTAQSGQVYSVNWTTALGALQKAAEIGEFNFSVNDSRKDAYGLVVDSIDGMSTEGDKMWKYWVNYPDDSVPLTGPDRFDLEDGDIVTFYRGDRRASPEESLRLNITVRTFLREPKALFITVESGASIKKAAEDAVLNVTQIPPDSIPTNLSGYDLIFLEMIGGETAQKLKPILDDPKGDGVPIIAIHSAGYENQLSNVDLEDYPAIKEYWNFGGLENMKNLFSYLGANFCGLDVPVEEPIPSPKAYIYHPDSADLFENTTSYLEWYKNKTGYSYNDSAPTIGILSYYRDMASITRIDLIRALEFKGVNVIDIGFSNTTTMKRLFIQNRTNVVDAVILTKSFRINYGDPDQGIRDLEELNVPVLNGMRLYYQTPEEWIDGTGISPVEVYMQVAMPEMDGVIEPIVISGRNDTVYDPIESQVNWLADRAISWAELGRVPSSEKKVAIIYYNHGGGKDNLGACYLNVPRSLQVILDGLNESGYKVEGKVPCGDDLVDLMAHEGTNVGTWAPGELDAMVKAGNATLIPVEEYSEWFNTIDPEKQNEVIERWGPPPGEIMVYVNKSGKYFVVPKLTFGNVILCPQPTRGWLQNNTVLYHNKDVPPHHQYIAFYFWLKNEFGADFIVHLGKHGTQEWLPGKECGISCDDCWPAVLIQDTPVIYPYIVDNIAEGSQAKRRGDAVMITHMTPAIVASGLYGNLTNLAETANNYNQVLNATVKVNYKETIIAQCEETHLDEDLEVNLTELSSDPEAFDDFMVELENYLYDLKNQFMPYGLHVFSQPIEGTPLVEMVESMLGDDYKREVAAMIFYEDYPNPSRLDKEKELDNCTEKLLTEVLLNHSSPEEGQMKVFSAILKNSTTNITVSENLTSELNLAQKYMGDLQTCTEELPRLINASNSSYTPPSPADDPIRDPDVLPTGRNFHSISPRKVPTTAAWETGQVLADNLIEEYRNDNNGTYPQKMAIVLWAWAMTDHGVVESEIFHLIGAKPVWDSYGGVTDVELVPLSELGRPRIDVLVVPSGLDRDLFPEKLKLIDRAIRLANNDTDKDYPNYVRKNSKEIKTNLMATGNYTEEDADYLSASRIFLEAAGTYGPNMDSAIGASNTWENDSKLGDLFIDRMSYIYGDEIWGSKNTSGKTFNNVQKDVYKLNLAEVDAAVQHTNSNLYGFIDNDDVFQYLGGIGLAVRTVTGETPPMYVTDVRDPNQQKVESLHSFFSKELRTRYYNPKWIRGMQSQGYSGAREMDKFTENLWGWDVTVPDLVTETMWNEAYDVYVNDKYDMGLKEFFDENNPYAFQVMSARMLETSRKGYWHPTEEMKKNLAEQFEQSEQNYGVTCCHHTCGNILLRQYMEGLVTGSESAKSSSTSKGGGHTKHPYTRESSSAGTSNQTLSSGVGTNAVKKPIESGSIQSEVTGHVMEEVNKETSSIPSISGAPLLGIILVLFILAVIGMGFRKKE
ncbi:MAG: cobaltochelatase subunit CobN [Methanotrichaceae archaeon]